VIGLRELGEGLDEVSKRLGHESTAFTLDTYGHLLPQRGREVASAFDLLLRKRGDGAASKPAAAGSKVVKSAKNGRGSRAADPNAQPAVPGAL
jgi:hypothetical protein